MISSLTDSRNLYTIVLYLRVLSMRRKCTSLHYFLEPALWEAIRLYSLILSGKINHESLFSLYIGILRSSRPVLLYIALFIYSLLAKEAFQAEGRFHVSCALLQNDKLRITNWPLKGHSRTRPLSRPSAFLYFEDMRYFMHLRNLFARQ